MMMYRMSLFNIFILISIFIAHCTNCAYVLHSEPMDLIFEQNLKAIII